MISGRASAALIRNRPNRDAKALSFDLTHSFRPFSSLGGGPPAAAVAPYRLVIMLQQVPRWPSR